MSYTVYPRKVLGFRTLHMQSDAEDGLDWWVDKDFGPHNLKSDLMGEAAVR